MSYYRNIYLKSEHWKTLRTEALLKKKARCMVCKSEEHLDVHHMRYRSLWDVKVKDLLVLCRDCHEKVHKLMKKYPRLSKMHPVRQLFTIKCHISPDRERVLDSLVEHAKVFAVHIDP